MKRVIKSSVEPEYLIFAGATIGDNNQILFNWSEDSSSDVVSLSKDTSGEFDRDGVRFVYGYEFNTGATGQQKKIFRDYVKGLSNSKALYSEDVGEFVERAVLRLDERYPLRDFKTTVHIEPTKSPSLVDVMREWLWEYLDNADVSFKLVKQAYEHVQFDAEKAAQALRDIGVNEDTIIHEIEFTTKKFDELKRSGELFQIKRFIPKAIREGFFNFLKFKTDKERKAYEALQGVNVLIFDDFMTSGATVKEVIRYLKAIHDKNTLTVFVLMKQ